MMNSPCFPRRSTPSATLAALGLCALIPALRTQAAPITGTYDNRAGNGLDIGIPDVGLPAGFYTIGAGTAFDRNGTSGLGSGLAAASSRLFVSGGDFEANPGAGAESKNYSSLIVTGGTFNNNGYGLYLHQHSWALIRGGSFESNNFVGLYVADHSFAVVNGGAFEALSVDANVLPNDVGTDGVRVDSQGSALINGGTMEGNNAGVLFKDATSGVVTGGLMNGNSAGLYVCTSPLHVIGGIFNKNTSDGALLTTDGSGNSSLLVDGGTFTNNADAGVVATATPGTQSVLTINQGTFTGNGIPGNASNDSYTYTGGGVAVAPGDTTVINGGQFHGNYPAATHADGTGASLTITGGDFTANGQGAYLLASGVDVQNGANAVVDGGNFSDNPVGVNVGNDYGDPFLTSQPVAATATIHGGTFGDSFADVDVLGQASSTNVSSVTITGGNFGGSFIGVNANDNAVVNISGGTFSAPVADFFVRLSSTLNLYGTFPGYDLSHGPVTLTGIGSVTGQLQNSSAPQTFTYRALARGQVVLNPPLP